MTDETIVAVYDTAEHAAMVIRDLEAAGVPSSAISQHAAGGMATGVTGMPATEQGKGFWSSLFGGEPEGQHDVSVYDRSMASGSTVVTVKAPEQYLAHTMEILERHNPIDIDERAATYSANSAVASAPAGIAPVAATGTASAAGTETIALSEEALAVGKRAINRGTTRVRRYVVETPVQEHVTLRDETVSVERRAVNDARPVTDGAFTDKLVEMTETAEEAVVSKTARVKEEIVIHKEAAERTETISDTLRHEDVEITTDSKPGPSVGAVPVTATPAQPSKI